jgi:hypothetical protein
MQDRRIGRIDRVNQKTTLGKGYLIAIPITNDWGTHLESHFVPDWELEDQTRRLEVEGDVLRLEAALGDVP